jgi:hypothetical protein
MATAITTILSTTTSTAVIAAAARRSSIVFANVDPNRFYFLQGGGTASATNYTGYLDENESVTISGDEAREAFSGIWAADGSGHVTVTATNPAALSAGAATWSLLALIRKTCDRLGLPRPVTVINSNDLQVKQLLALAEEEAEELSGYADWRSLMREVTFTTVAAAEQPGAIPADSRKLIPNSFFNRSTMRPVVGPVTPQQWQLVQAQPAANRVILAFRERDGAFLMTPNPPAGETIAFEYVTNEWAISADETTTYTTWNADTDLTYLNPQLLMLGLRWRWRKTKGLPYAEDYDTYTAQKEMAKARDGGSSALSVTRSGSYRVGNPNLPEGNFG